jgi:hypothetical protein
MELAGVEAKAALGAAEADRAELAGVGVDPVAVDGEQLGDCGGVDVAGKPRPAVVEQLGDPGGDPLDVVAVEHAHLLPPPPGCAVGSVVGSVRVVQWAMRARAMRR